MSAMLLTTLGFRASYRVERVNGPAPIGVREFRKPVEAVSPAGIALRTSAKDIVLEVEPAGGEHWTAFV